MEVRRIFSLQTKVADAARKMRGDDFAQIPSISDRLRSALRQSWSTVVYKTKSSSAFSVVIGKLGKRLWLFNFGGVWTFL